MLLFPRLRAWLSPTDALRDADLIFVLAGRVYRKDYALELFRQGLAPRIMFSVGRFEIRRFSKMALPVPLDLLKPAQELPPPQRHYFVFFEGQEVETQHVLPGRFGTLTEIEALARWLSKRPGNPRTSHRKQWNPFATDPHVLPVLARSQLEVGLSRRASRSIGAALTETRGATPRLSAARGELGLCNHEKRPNGTVQAFDLLDFAEVALTAQSTAEILWTCAFHAAIGNLVPSGAHPQINPIETHP